MKCQRPRAQAAAYIRQRADSPTDRDRDRGGENRALLDRQSFRPARHRRKDETKLNGREKAEYYFSRQVTFEKERERENEEGE